MIELKNLHLAFGEQRVLSAQDLHIAPGESAAFMGPSGCGKTSLLRLIAGLEKPVSGTVSVRSRRLSYLFQEPRLLPWLTAEQNVNAVLSDSPATLPQARTWLEAVGLEDAAAKYPAELSGGMQQRVSLARALAFGGDILLLDEPFKGLDGETRNHMISLLRTHAAGKTLLLATHDRDEAAALTEKLYLFDGQRFQESH